MILFASCNKAAKVEKKLIGEWTITKFTFQNLYGLSYIYPSTGEITFEGCNDEYCNYDIKLDYNVNGLSLQKNEAGLYKLDDDAEHFTFLRNNPDGTVSTLDQGRILLINSDQMKILFKDEMGIYHFVLEK